MKYIVILGDGMADEPLAQLGVKPPLNLQKHRIWTGWHRTALAGCSGQFLMVLKREAT